MHQIVWYYKSITKVADPICTYGTRSSFKKRVQVVSFTTNSIQKTVLDGIAKKLNINNWSDWYKISTKVPSQTLRHLTERNFKKM